MIRYIRLYLYFLRFSFSKAMEFRVDFFFRVVMDIIFYIIQFLFFNILYLHTPVLGGWNIEQMKIFVCAFIFVDAFNMTFFANNAWWFPIYINRGELDYYLTKPVSSFFFLGFREFAANSLINLLLASSILSYFLYISPLNLEPFKIFIFVLLLINGAFLYFMTNLIFLLPVFWSGSPRGFADVFYSAEKVFQRPDGIFSGLFKSFFTRVLPFSVMASLPTKYLFETDTTNTLLIIATSSLCVYFSVFLIWKVSLKNYTSASS